ncbi:hypothetical protein [Falsirhodobacter algicola]|uniref:Uncharacterized protein n=1 Tax=Falsirhodobacter algicola TaxID=2692330 RepID=A0A8J8MSR5_9RHOB|nr:hypothetical protein [Falsirhodobacter algicola]QUS35990.1 hypothetical protein GR316_06760 [Falsirhodobacter algicola]
MMALPASAGEVTIAPPDGYCTAGAGEAGIVHLRPCDGADGPEMGVLIGPEGSGTVLANPARVAGWLGSAEGLASLSGPGWPNAVIHEMTSAGDAIVMLVGHRGSTDLLWRILVPLRGRLVTLTLPTAPGANVAEDRGAALRLLFAMRSANPELGGTAEE